MGWKLLAVLVGLAACALLGALFLQEEPAPPAAPDGLGHDHGGAASPGAGSGGPVLHGSAAPGGVPAAHGVPSAPAVSGPFPDGFEPAPGAVRGVVLGTGGRPAVGVVVNLEGLNVPRTARTDAAGRFAFEKIPAHHSVRLWAAEAGLVPGGTSFGARFGVEPGRTHEVEVRLVDGLTTHGRVVRWDGSAVADARVWVVVPRFDAPPSYVERLVAQSGAEGSFRIEGLPRNVSRSSLEVHAVAPGLPEGSTSVGQVLLAWDEVARRPEDPIEIVLGEPCFVDVRVVDEETGQGVPAAVVGKGDYGRVELARTDADGRCRIGPVPPGPQAWTVHAKGWGAAFEQQLVQAEAVPGHVPAVIHTLYRVYDIQGRVVYADGKPADDRGYGLAVKGPAYGMSTDIQGTFHIRGIPKGTYEVAICSRGMEGASVDATDGSVLGRAFLEAGTTDAVIVLEGNRPVDLEVIVRDGTGALLPRGAVLVGCDDEEWRMQNCWGLVGFEDGTAHLSGILQPVWIEVLAPPGTPWAPRRVGPIAPGTPRVEVQLETGLSITGRVVGPDGEPVADVDVMLDANATEAEDERFGSRDHGEAHTLEDGAFAFDRLWKAPYWLHVSPPKAYARVESLEVTAGGREIVVRLRKRVDVALPILDAAGAPLVGAQVQLWTPPWFSDGTALTATTDAEGVAHMRGVDPKATYYLEVTPPRTVTTSRRLWQEGWHPSDNPVRLPAAWSFDGVVRGPDGKPVAGASVRLEYAEDRPASSTPTDAQGRFRFGQLSFEPVELTAHAAGGFATASTTRVQAPTAEVALTLEAHAGRLRVRLEAWPRPAPPEWVGQEEPTAFFLWDPAAPERRVIGRPTPEGVVTLEGLDPTVAWSLLVTRADHDLCVRADGVIADGEPRALRARASQPLRGIVRAPEGTWPHQVTVLETGRSYDIDDNGSYQIPGLPPGRWTLRASAYHGRDLIYRSVVAVEATAPTIDFARAR